MGIARIGFLLALLIALPGCGSPSWTEYASAEGGFKVLLPDSPKASSQTTLLGELKKVEATQSGSVFGVEWVQLPEGMEDAVREPFLTAMRKDCLAGLNAQLLSERKLMREDRYLGQEFVADLPIKANLLQVRCFLEKDRLYRVFSLIPKSSLETPEVIKFFDSFQVTK